MIAGILGWSGIWGTGSALVEYLIPVPVAGGFLHVPSFVVATGIILISRRSTGLAFRYLPVLAFSTLAVALSLMLEFDRLHAWLFTDYQPPGSPFRLDGNPLLLFVATDAFWVGFYALTRGFAPPARAWFALPLVPAVVIGLSVANYQMSGPTFKIGGPIHTSSRGEEIIMVFTSADYDEDAFLNWIQQDHDFARPWFDANAEHVAVLFTNSMQMLGWRELDKTESDSTIATICLYEEDRSIVPYSGYHDCFAERLTLEQALAALRASEPTGLGTDVDSWYARLRLCDDVEIPEQATMDIAREDLCAGVVRGYPKTFQRFVEKYGENSAQVNFISAQAASRGLRNE